MQADIIYVECIRFLSAPLGLQLLGDCPDVVRLDAAAAADVAHAQLVGRPGEPVHVPARVHARLHGRGELGESLVPGFGKSCIIISVQRSGENQHLDRL